MTHTDLSEVLDRLLPKCDCRGSSCFNSVTGNEDTVKQRHDNIITSVLLNKTLFRTIVYVGRLPHASMFKHCNPRIYKYDELNDADIMLSETHQWHYVLVERLQRQPNNSSNKVLWTHTSLEKLIELMPYAVFKHVFDTNRYTMLYYHNLLICYAVKYGRLDVYKLLEAQAHDNPDIFKVIFDHAGMTSNNGRPIHLEKHQDHLVTAIIHGRLAMFEYLLSQTNSIVVTSGLEARKRKVEEKHIKDWQQMATALRLLITFLNGLPSAPRVDQLIICPLRVLLRCQDVELVRRAVNHISFNYTDVSQYCESAFRPTTGIQQDKVHALYCSDLEQPADRAQLEHSLNFLIQVYAAYQIPVPPTNQQYQACELVLNEVGMIFLRVFAIMSHGDNQPDLLSFIRKGIFMNVHQEYQQTHLESFIQYFLSLEMKGYGQVLGLETICTFGTLDMVKTAHQIVSQVQVRYKGETISLNIGMENVYPMTLEIMEYIQLHNLFSISSVKILNHVASMGRPDLLKAYLETYPNVLSKQTNQPFYFKAINNNLELSGKDTNNDAIRSILVAEYTNPRISMTGRSGHARNGMLIQL
ncbi:hypothetical protein SAMD00019534_099460 [Acytostelium subglobosum LB1]|uniref:hypothetical protein n=1 Tax=Acytostelium subglobosum LB1 TaxID=1410327 RepID=UPI0006448BAE|nr:hypothetical protein SAMD00019534_099460 [Acytostelium subglobosum LB1]GAM26771.1 hypothetical protein SAMD00019534_099460 [Acytostelium subglobosum LB1]|eukprot:XP_012750432.1 hypothetical protein SAMD00019534_099460 [Acytostelium subglobosum LB1]